MTARFLDEAAAELASAVAGYEAKSPGLGLEFAVAIRDGLARIEAYPTAWQLIGQRVRRYRLNRFPYGLVYAEVGSDIVILALMHLHRKQRLLERAAYTNLTLQFYRRPNSRSISVSFSST